MIANCMHAINKDKEQKTNKKGFIQKSLVIIAFLIILTLSFQHTVYAKELSFQLKEFKTGRDISHGFVEISAQSEKNHRDFKITLENQSIVKLDLEDTTWDFIISVDDEKTPSYDYFVKHHVEKGWNSNVQTIYLFPVGSVKVQVEDLNGDLISNAEVKIECLENRFLKVNTKTDFFGMTSNQIVPVGNCSAFAFFNDAAGITSFNMIKGQAKKIIITLDKKVVSKYNTFMRNSTIALSIIAAAVVFALLLKKKTKSNENKNKSLNKDTKEVYSIEIEHDLDNSELYHKESVETPNVIPSRLSEVMKTLKPKEKAVVEYLIAHNFSQKQSKIRYDLEIPKTTFSRIIKSLESKHIIIVEKDKKPAKVKINPDLL